MVKMVVIPAPQRFKTGDIIRYGDGVSALFRYSGTNNCDRLYGDHVLGGAHSACDMIFTHLELASEADLAYCREWSPEWFAAEVVQP